MSQGLQLVLRSSVSRCGLCARLESWVHFLHWRSFVHSRPHPGRHGYKAMRKQSEWTSIPAVAEVALAIVRVLSSLNLLIMACGLEHYEVGQIYRPPHLFTNATCNAAKNVTWPNVSTCRAPHRSSARCSPSALIRTRGFWSFFSSLQSDVPGGTSDLKTISWCPTALNCGRPPSGLAAWSCPCRPTARP